MVNGNEVGKNMFLSFVVPVYNTEKYLAECLDSLLDQGIPYYDYEIICVNDGSTDGSLQILRSYEKKCANIRVIDTENSGVSTARNKGIDAARGDYIWFVDSDDFIRRGFLTVLYNHINETDADRVKIGTYVVNGEMSAAECSALEKNELKVNSHFYDSSSVTCILRRSFLLHHDCKFRYPELTHGEDSIFMFEVVAHSPLCTEIDIPIYFYRKRPNSAMTAITDAAKERQLNSHFLAAQIMKQYYDNRIGEDRNTANLLMSFIWYTMNECAQLSGYKRKVMLRKVKTAGIYPFTRPELCSHVRSYQTTRTDVVGKIFDKVYISTHRPWGFRAMCGLQKLIALKHSVISALQIFKDRLRKP